MGFTLRRLTVHEKAVQGRGSSAPGKAILCMVIGSAALTANDAVLKWMTSDYHVAQIMLCRGLFISIPLTILVWRAGGLITLRTSNIKGHSLRAFLVIIGTFLFVSGLKYLPITDAVAIAFAGPLFITALAPKFLGEQVGWRRWVAVLAGFTGIMLIIRPGSDVFQWAALLPLAASLTGAFRDILTRGMSATETSEALLCYTSFGVVLAALIYSPSIWTPVSLEDWGWFALGGLFIGSAHFLMIETYRYGEAVMVAPFKYSGVIWAAFLGYLIWNDVPNMSTVFGIVIVVSASLYILQRERLRQAL